MIKIISKLIDINAREVARLEQIAKKINDLEAKTKKLKDNDFIKKTEEFKELFWQIESV